MIAFGVVAVGCGAPEPEASTPSPVCAAGQIDGDLNVFSWPDYLPTEVLDGFRRRFGVEVSMATYDTDEVLLGQLQVRADNYDVAFPSDYMVDILIEDGFLLEIDKDALTNLGNLDPSFLDPPFDPEGSHSIPYQWGTVGLGINRNVVGSEVVASWGIVFDPDQASQWAGRISLLDDARQSLGAALKYLGYSANSRSEEEVAQAGALLRLAAENLAPLEDADYAQQLVDGEADVAQGRSNAFFDAFNSSNAGNDFAYIVPVEGTIAWVENMVVPVTSESPCTAHTFIDYLMEPANAAAGTNFTKFATANLAASRLIDPAILANPAIYPPEAAMAGLEFLANTGEFEIRYIEEYSRGRG
ncbi:MAG TPA: spermidine/putrescine ABC transporter substrate-binding protein [Actinobacteria bacterium]|nr:spermidine/putrescine ABC transporter substrate-binding protein [Actinomycetota bacterium]